MAKKIPLLGLELSVKKQLSAAINELSDLYEDKLRENISLEDHTLQELRDLGYPYSRTHGRSIHNPDYLVHKQSGSLEDALTVNKINQYLVRIGIDDAKAPHIIHIMFGTSKMRPRNVIVESFREIQDKFVNIIEKQLDEALK